MKGSSHRKLAERLETLSRQHKELMSKFDLSPFIEAPKYRVSCKLHSLLSLSKACDRINYGPPISIITDPPSSGEDSEMEGPANQGPTIQEVAMSIFDETDFVPVPDFNDIPVSHPPALLFSQVDGTLTAVDLLKELNKIRSDARIDCIKVFERAETRAAFVQFADPRSARSIYNFFKSGSRTIKNSRGVKIEVQWCTQQSLLNNSTWVAVVLRNVPPETPMTALFQNCTKGGEKVKRITKPECIKGQFCALVVLDFVEDAEKLCIRLNGLLICKEKRLKAHIHPCSSLKRTNKELSHHKIFADMNSYLQARTRKGGQDPNFAVGPPAELPPASAAEAPKTEVEKPVKKVEKRHCARRGGKESSSQFEKRRMRDSVRRHLLSSPESEDHPLSHPPPEEAKAGLAKVDEVTKRADPSLTQSFYPKDRPTPRSSEKSLSHNTGSKMRGDSQSGLFAQSSHTSALNVSIGKSLEKTPEMEVEHDKTTGEELHPADFPPSDPRPRVPPFDSSSHHRRDYYGRGYRYRDEEDSLEEMRDYYDERYERRMHERRREEHRHRRRSRSCSRSRSRSRSHSRSRKPSRHDYGRRYLYDDPYEYRFRREFYPGPPKR